MPHYPWVRHDRKRAGRAEVDVLDDAVAIYRVPGADRTTVGVDGPRHLQAADQQRADDLPARAPSNQVNSARGVAKCSNIIRQRQPEGIGLGSRSAPHDDRCPKRAVDERLHRDRSTLAVRQLTAIGTCPDQRPRG